MESSGTTDFMVGIGPVGLSEVSNGGLGLRNIALVDWNNEIAAG